VKKWVARKEKLKNRLAAHIRGGTESQLIRPMIFRFRTDET
jgi:hypothetical protein